MGYRIYAITKELELGKQYDDLWDEFNLKWFNSLNGSGIIQFQYLIQFYEELKYIDEKTKINKLYNLDKLELLCKFCESNKIDLEFQSY